MAWIAPFALLTVLLALPGGLGATEDVARLGRELYVERCVLCHGSEGHGWDWSRKVIKPPVPVPNLVETVPTLDDQYLKRIILDGGEAVGRTRFMPAFRFDMKDREAEALIKYLRAITGSRRSQ